jgi:hypothetical protein
MYRRSVKGVDYLYHERGRSFAAAGYSLHLPSLLLLCPLSRLPIVRMKSFTQILLLTSVSLVAALPAPTPPNIPSVTTSRSQLAALTVAPWGSSSGYSRDLFPHWITQSGYVGVSLLFCLCPRCLELQ